MLAGPKYTGPAAVRQKTHRSGSSGEVVSASVHGYDAVTRIPMGGISTGGGAHAATVATAARVAPRSKPFIVADLLRLHR
jgi:hypothetical protein